MPELINTPEIYIGMCRKAKELQDHVPQAGDCYFARGAVVILPMPWQVEDFCSYECMYLISVDEEIWLPRQEDLQRILKGNYVSIRKMFVHFGHWCSEYGDVKASGEQLWLTFLYHELYHKEWNGEDWAREDSCPS